MARLEIRGSLVIENRSIDLASINGIGMPSTHFDILKPMDCGECISIHGLK